MIWISVVFTMNGHELEHDISNLCTLMTTGVIGVLTHDSMLTSQANDPYIQFLVGCVDHSNVSEQSVTERLKKITELIRANRPNADIADVSETLTDALTKLRDMLHELNTDFNYQVLPSKTKLPKKMESLKSALTKALKQSNELLNAINYQPSQQLS